MNNKLFRLPRQHVATLVELPTAVPCEIESQPKMNCILTDTGIQWEHCVIFANSDANDTDI